MTKNGEKGTDNANNVVPLRQITIHEAQNPHFTGFPVMLHSHAG